MDRLCLLLIYCTDGAMFRLRSTPVVGGRRTCGELLLVFKEKLACEVRHFTLQTTKVGVTSRILRGRDRAVPGHGSAHRTELQPVCFARKLLIMQHSIFAVRFHVDHY